MDATALALGWMLLAQVPGNSPWGAHNSDVVIPNGRPAAPAASIQDDDTVYPGNRSTWGGNNANHTRAVPAQGATSAWGQNQGDTSGRFMAGDSGNYNTRTTTNGPALGSAANSARTAAAGSRLFGLRRSGDNNNSGNNFSSALLVPLASRSGNRLPSEVLAHAMSPPQGSNLAGRQVSLMEVISRAADRRQQLKATQAYWRLLAAEAEFYWQSDEAERMEQIVPYRKGKVSDENSLKMARNAAWGRLREAELHVLTAQHEVADIIRLDDFEMLPLAGDQPLSGPYKTYFRELFSDREPPGRTRLIAANLPVRLKLIETRTEAIFDATDSVRLAVDEHNRGEVDVHSLVECINDLREERHDFLVAIREYNDDIAEYALSVANPGTNNATLVGMMIKTNNLTANLPRGRFDNGGYQNGNNNSPAYDSGPTYNGGTNNNSPNYNGGMGNGQPYNGAPAYQRQPNRAVRPIDYQQDQGEDPLQRPASTHKRHGYDGPIQGDTSTFAEPSLLPDEVLRTSNRLSPNQPVSVLVRPIRE